MNVSQVNVNVDWLRRRTNKLCKVKTDNNLQYLKRDGKLCGLISVDMNPRALLLLSCHIVLFVSGQNQVCYDVIGCFQTGEPWSSLLRPVPEPQGPDVVNVFFVLYTRNNPVDPFYIVGDTTWSVDGSYYDSQKETIVYIHGYQGQTNETEDRPLVDAFLRSGDVNIILVDYGSIREQGYLHAVSNIRVVAALTARFLNYLIQERNASASNFHVVGFSLGAHVAGYVGKRISGIRRITGLDAAQPLFEGQSKELRLDKGDADLVDIGHTNGSPTVPLVGLGFVAPIGDVDFYFNGGWDQPGCTKNVLGLVLNGSLNVLNVWPLRFVCPHERALTYFIEAMGNENCTFWGIKEGALNSGLRVLSGGWLSPILTSLENCNLESCLPFGKRTFDFPARGVFQIATSTKPSYCLNSRPIDRLMQGQLNAS
ncbi:hypothetical protein L9F63_011569 [Diploptera punctata]|uniref:Lipase domain-containing protein n=1 Tax=Diploptera punctata TaxID=6984 RepID=A0AAD8EPA2_DIPPU|nr:hypothetical protein L9F63_011569 [Diploptera punctata]